MGKVPTDREDRELWGTETGEFLWGWKGLEESRIPSRGKWRIPEVSSKGLGFPGNSRVDPGMGLETVGNL